jgi:hypothetical protein
VGKAGCSKTLAVQAFFVFRAGERTVRVVSLGDVNLLDSRVLANLLTEGGKGRCCPHDHSLPPLADLVTWLGRLLI